MRLVAVSASHPFLACIDKVYMQVDIVSTIQIVVSLKWGGVSDGSVLPRKVL